MPVQDGIMGDREGGEGETAMGGGERGRGGADSVFGTVAVVVDNKNEDDSGGRRGTKQQPTP